MESGLPLRWGECASRFESTKSVSEQELTNDPSSWLPPVVDSFSDPEHVVGVTQIAPFAMLRPCAVACIPSGLSAFPFSPQASQQGASLKFSPQASQHGASDTDCAYGAEIAGGRAGGSRDNKFTDKNEGGNKGAGDAGKNIDCNDGGADGGDRDDQSDS